MTTCRQSATREYEREFLVRPQATHVDHLAPVAPLSFEMSVLVSEFVQRLVEFAEEEMVDGVDLACPPGDGDDATGHGLSRDDHEVRCSSATVADESAELDANVLHPIGTDRQLRGDSRVKRMGGATLPVAGHADHDVSGDLVIAADRRAERRAGVEQLLQVSEMLVLRELTDLPVPGDHPATAGVVLTELIEKVAFQVRFQLRPSRHRRAVGDSGAVFPCPGGFEGSDVEVRDAIGRDTHWAEKPTGTTDVMGRMRWDAPSLTIRTEFFKPEKGQYLHPQWETGRPSRQVNRVITHYEASLLQDFPPDFEWCGTKVEIAKQIGNAVPSGLAAAIARQVKAYLA